jgi:hypothetical protein
MSFLKKLFGKRHGAPEWASFMGDAEYPRFMELVQADLRARGLKFEVSGDQGTLKVTGEEGPQLLGLSNLAQRCHQLSAENWAPTIHRHFDTLLVGTPKAAELLKVLAADFERAKEYLKVRIHPAGFGAGLDATVSEVVADDLVSVLVYDFPDSVSTVHPNHVEKWGVPPHDLFQLGLRNVRAEGKLPFQRIELTNGASLDHFEDPDNYFGASHALLLHEYFDPLPDLGILVSIPHRHGMVVHPIRDASYKPSLGALFYLAPRLYEQGPGSITTSLYWYRAGVFTQLPYEIDANDEVSFYPPASFQEQVAAKIGAAD